MSDETTDNLAVKIARLLRSEKPDADFHSLQASVERISERLDKIEKMLNKQNSSVALHSPFTNPHSKPHPSQEKFAVDEGVAHQTVESLETEKPCIFEPNGKPCDYCSMCSSRGF